MKHLCRPFHLAVLACMLPAFAEAHPGHDGHELTWDAFSAAPSHLAAHPWATAGCALGLAALTWAVVRMARGARALKAPC